MSDSEKKFNQSDNVLITFLTEVRDGVYAPVDKNSLPYSRLKEQINEPCEEEYFYSIR